MTILTSRSPGTTSTVSRGTGTSATTELEQVLEGIPWLAGFSLGAGIDAVTGGISRKAVKPFTPVLHTVKTYGTRLQLIQDEHGYLNEVEASAGGEYNIAGVAASSSLGYLRALSFSELSATLVAEYTSGYAGCDDAPSYELTDEAKDLIKDPERFRHAYGDYFIASGRRKSRFIALYTCSARSTEDLSKFTASFGGAIPDVFTADGSGKFIQAATQGRITVKIRVYASGVSHMPEKSLWNPTDVINALAWFMQHEVGEIMTAKLQHYSTLSPTYPRNVEIEPTAFVEVKSLYRLLWDVHGVCGSLPPYYQRKLSDTVTQFSATVAARGSTLASDTAARGKLINEGRELMGQLNSVLDRMVFYSKVRSHSEPKKGQVTEEQSGQPQIWCYGYREYPKIPSVVIQQNTLRFAKGFSVDSQQGSLVFGPQDGSLIVGWQVVSNWVDGTNGKWWKASDRILLASYGEVAVRSGSLLGCDWTVSYFYVDARDYQFDDE